MTSNRPLRVLVIGVGSIGERHVRCFQKTNRAVVSICEMNDEARTRVANAYSVDRQYNNLDQALADLHDAVVIAVPANLHVAMARQAIAANLHVLIEKPLSLNNDGIDELVAVTRSSRRIAAVGYVYRAHPALAEMRSAIHSGQFGAPLQVVVVAGQNFPTYRPAYAQSYYASRAQGGGAIQDAMTHLANAVEWLVGPTTRVVADADHLVLPEVQVEDTVHYIARHNRILANYSLNQFQSANEVTITVACERGTVRFEYHNHRWRHMLAPDTAWHDHPASGLERDTLFTNQASAFLDAVEGVGNPLCDLQDGAHTLRVNLAILRSLSSHHWEEV